MDLLDMIMRLREEKRQKEHGSIINEILGQAMAPTMGGMEQMQPSIGIPQEAAYVPGPFYPGPGGMQVQAPTVPPPEVLSQILTDPRLPLDAKIRGFELLNKVMPAGEQGVVVGPEDVLLGKQTGKELGRGIGKTKEKKRYPLKENEVLFDEEGNEIARGLPGKPKLVKVNPGEKVLNEETKEVIFEYPKEISKEDEGKWSKAYKDKEGH